MRGVKRQLTFLGVGIVNTFADFLCYTLLTTTIFKDSSLIALAGITSGTIALVIAFILHSFITWRDRQISHKELARFILITGIGMWLIRPLLLTIFIKFEGLYRLLHAITEYLNLHVTLSFVSNTGAFFLMIGILLCYNYVTYDLFVFSHSKDEDTTYDKGGRSH